MVTSRPPYRDGPPREGEVQLHFLSGGGFALPDGRQARAGDYCNVVADVASRFATSGCANIVTPAVLAKETE